MKAFEKRIYLSSPTMHGEEMKFVKEAYDTNWMSAVGSNIDAVEKSVCQMTGSGYAIAVSCGTAALHLAVKLAGVAPGDTVFCSDMTFAATSGPILYEKGRPVFIDSEYDSWNMDPQALKKAFQIYPDTRVVVLAHLYGTPSKLDEILDICKRYKAILIEDAAESMGATFRGTQTGVFGDIAVFSFNGNKIITGSTGGMLLTSDSFVAQKAKKWSTQSRETAPWYQHEELGYNYRMSNVVAGIVRGQLRYLEEHIARKKEIYMRYREGLSDLPVQMNPYQEETMSPNFWLSCLLINKEAMCMQQRGDKEAVFVKEKGKTCPTEILELLDRYNAEGRPLWKPMHMQPLYENCPFVTKEGAALTKSWGCSPDLFHRGLCLPSDIKMTENEQRQIIHLIRSCFV
ncbi:MAG: aminotransferase class V-fold PLP-dependent enzyme [Clostridia bacterium]|nr:aminotransferase class V-fold PLP-dependent enzyme [Clostridia bacterium]